MGSGKHFKLKHQSEASTGANHQNQVDLTGEIQGVQLRDHGAAEQQSLGSADLPPGRAGEIRAGRAEPRFVLGGGLCGKVQHQLTVLAQTGRFSMQKTGNLLSALQDSLLIACFSRPPHILLTDPCAQRG